MSWLVAPSCLQEKAEKLGMQSEVLLSLRASFEAQLRLAAVAAAKKDDELRAHEQLLATNKEQLKEV